MPLPFSRSSRPPTVEGLRAEILSGYDIVHFDGHGSFGVRCPNCGGLNQADQKKCARCECLLEGENAKGHFAFEREDGKLDALAAVELAEDVFKEMVAYKHRNMKRAYWALLAGFVTMVVAMVYYLRFLDGPSL